MINTQNQLNQKLEHYKKIKNRWIIMENVSNVLGIALTVGTGIITIIASSGTIIIPVVVLSLTGSSMLGSLITALTGKVFINRHKKRIKLKLKQIETVLSELRLFFEKCKEDNIITLKEMEEFEKILDGEINEINSGTVEVGQKIKEKKTKEKKTKEKKEKKKQKKEKKRSFRDEEMERLETGIRDIKEQLKTMDFNGSVAGSV